MVTFLGQIPISARFLPMKADKFIEINAYGTSLTAASTTQAGPYLTALNQLPVRLHRGTPYNLPGRKAGNFTAYGTASRTHAAFHAVFDLYWGEFHCLFYQAPSSGWTLDCLSLFERIVTQLPKDLDVRTNLLGKYCSFGS
jgi:hypothetical protein